jgi:hypothetical protein
VTPNVTAHECHGCAVYHYFRDFAVEVEAGIAAPTSAVFNSTCDDPDSSLQNMKPASSVPPVFCHLVLLRSVFFANGLSLSSALLLLLLLRLLPRFPWLQAP